MPPTTKRSTPFQVYARWRPLPPSETTPTTPDPGLKHTTSQHGSQQSISLHTTAPSGRPATWNSGPSFTQVFSPDNDNNAVYKRVVLPTLPAVLDGETCTFFAYGHSGSGKTHTIIGYEFECEGKETEMGKLGLCLSAARDVFAGLDTMEARSSSGADEKADTGNNETDKELGIAVRMYQVRGKFAFDMLSSTSGECHIREGPDGTTHIRGATETLPGGKIRVRPITSTPCWNLASLRATLLRGLTNRDIGASSVHDESSRTHAIIELEIVNTKLLEKRDALIDRESELVPVGKRATDVYLAEQLASMVMLDDGSYVQRAERPINQGIIDAAEAEKRVCEDAVREAEREVAACFAEGQKGLGGKYVFVDLAGAEYFSASKTTPSASSSSGGKALKQTLAEQQQGRQINTDLFALKEVIRARAQGKSRTPYRASPLTMVLRSCFEGGGKVGGSSAMIVTLCAEEGMEAATRNSLKYGGLVGSAGGK
ncbi:P-loop containing nucleoside triphosphate hydrolase protein [Pyrenochaeta sp. DS3sAY3a]|nr:P-loop containing nucleoside triphosphate hydrolase protein [Pyrenochaeta sp. DS3sAY3a]